ncbi:hypothetical protein [Actinomadura algeriensis]|uniref:Uncharacterized protein n=1 Tax=Actinomadura algeriensis TaxID=1679523 RepID=A0ABR9JHY7_9ACTN|nr:hypothetical protein [Actinomadura algeriensis]MBE1530177.1 hypothetical protein [Actinomadura algeriensis]
MYVYVGPAELFGEVDPDAFGEPVGADAARLQDEPFTYVVDLDGVLRLAPRRSEHVACAGGRPVLAAGEIAFEGGRVVEVTNQSTGYCPGPESWTAVAEALDRAGLDRPDGFTDTFVFRRCPSCAELNVVKDEYYVCVFCDADL